MNTLTITLTIPYEHEERDDSVGFRGGLIIGPVTDQNGNEVPVTDAWCEMMIERDAKVFEID